MCRLWAAAARNRDQLHAHQCTTRLETVAQRRPERAESHEMALSGMLEEIPDLQVTDVATARPSPFAPGTIPSNLFDELKSLPFRPLRLFGSLVLGAFGRR